MKKLLAVFAVFTLMLAACGAKTESYKGEVSKTDEEGVTTVTTVTYDKAGDDITNVQIGSVKGDVDKRSADYTMNGDQGTWPEQADALAKYIEENDAAPTPDAEGSVADTVSSTTISAGDIVEAFNAATVQ